MSWRHRGFTWKPRTSLTKRKCQWNWLVDFAYLSHSPCIRVWKGDRCIHSLGFPLRSRERTAISSRKTGAFRTAIDVSRTPLNLGGRLANWIVQPSRIVRVSQRDRLGSVSHASRRCASGSNGTIDVHVVVQRKGVGGGWHRRRCVLRHPHRTPWVPNRTGQRCVGRNVVPEPYSLGYRQNGSWARVRRQGVAHCRPMDLRTRRKRKLLFLWEGGYLQNRNQTKQKILLPALHRGKERRCSRRLLRKSKLQHLRVARVRAASSTSWMTWGLAGTRGAPLSCERLDAPAYVSIRPGAEQLWRTQEGAHGDGQTEAWPRGQRWMVHHAGAGWGGQGGGCLARSTVSFGRESGCQLTGLGRETRTVPPSGGVSWAKVHRDRSLHLGNARVPPGHSAVEGSEDGGGGRAASGRERGHPRTRQLLMHLREERHRGRARLWAVPRSEKPIIQPRDTEDNDRVRHPQTENDRNAEWHGRNGILKKTRSSVICSFRICSLSWSAQGNRWWEGLCWSHRYANREQNKDERICGDQHSSHPLGSEAKI